MTRTEFTRHILETDCCTCPIYFFCQNCGAPSCTATAIQFYTIKERNKEELRWLLRKETSHSD